MPKMTPQEYEDWVKLLKKEEDVLNKRSQEIKEEVKKELEDGKIKIDFDEIREKIKWFRENPEEVVFMTRFISTLVGIIEYSIPLVATFFPITRLGYIAIGGLRLLKLYLNRKLSRRIEMELKLLNKDTAEIALFGCATLNGIGLSFEDNEIEWTDAVHFKDAVVALPAAVGDASKAEWPEGEALKELNAFIAAKLDLPQDGIETLVEEGLRIGFAVLEAWKKYKK